METKANISRKILLIFLIFISTTQISLATTNSIKIYQKYIKTSCTSTTYPNVCYQTLYPYATTIKTDPYKLCDTALSVAVKAAKNASSTVSAIAKQKGLKTAEKRIVKDCIENVKDSVDELKDSLKSMNDIGNSRGSVDSTSVAYQMADIKTWVSAALTDEDTCMDEFDDGTKVNQAVKKKIRTSVLNVAQLTSNSLALINLLKY
ncbi:hypothetical protein ACFE04_027596 [Oxalis oulophora]